MKNKLLVNVYVMCLSQEYELYVPANESVKAVVDLIVKLVSELSDDRLNKNNMYCLIDCESNVVYNYDLVVRNTNIINGKKLILI